MRKNMMITLKRTWRNFPELDFTDEQLKEAVSKLSTSDYEQYVQLRDQ